MAMHFRAFGHHKRGNSAEEYEDAFAADPPSGRFAIADGASETSFAALWAKLLVEKFIRAPLADAKLWEEWLTPLQALWARQVNGQQLEWYAEEKAQQGAFATFMGIIVKQSRWQAIGVGDCCCFQIRGDKLFRAFPLSRSDQFTNNPGLLGSRTGPTRMGEKQQFQAVGDWKSSDRLLLMTDALAQWFLTQSEKGKKPWEAVRPLLEQPITKQAFAAWIEKLRDKEGLRNDDVTLLALKLQKLTHHEK